MRVLLDEHVDDVLSDVLVHDLGDLDLELDDDAQLHRNLDYLEYGVDDDVEHKHIFVNCDHICYYDNVGDLDDVDLELLDAEHDDDDARHGYHDLEYNDGNRHHDDDALLQQRLWRPRPQRQDVRAVQWHHVLGRDG